MSLLSLSYRVEGARVALRAPRLADARPLVELRMASWEFLRPWMPAPTGAELDPSSMRERIRRERRMWSRDRGYRLVLALHATEEVVGAVGLTEIVRGAFQNAYLGYWIGEPWAHQGLMSEALLLALGLAFGPLGLHRVQAAISPRNVPSLALARKVGLREEGLSRRYLELAGTWEDHLLFAMTREEWTPAAAAAGATGAGAPGHNPRSGPGSRVL